MKYKEFLDHLYKKTSHILLYCWDENKQPKLSISGFCDIEDALKDAKQSGIEDYDVIQIEPINVFEVSVTISAPLRRNNDVFLAK